MTGEKFPRVENESKSLPSNVLDDDFDPLPSNILDDGHESLPSNVLDNGYEPFADHMAKMESANENQESVEENPNKIKYLGELEEIENKLDKLQEEYADSLDEADVYFAEIDKLKKENHAIEEHVAEKVIQMEKQKLISAVSRIEENAGKLFKTNEEFGDYLKLGADFLTPEEKAKKDKKYFANVNNISTDLVKFEDKVHDLLHSEGVKEHLYRY